LADAGADVAAANRSGERPLFWAAGTGTIEAARRLLERGAPVDAPDADGHTALHAAADGGHAEMALVLLDARADPRLANRAGERPVDLARRRGYDDVVRLLEARGR
jgi:ankyrin repeat protein